MPENRRGPGQRQRAFGAETEGSRGRDIGTVGEPRQRQRGAKADTEGSQDRNRKAETE